MTKHAFHRLLILLLLLFGAPIPVVAEEILLRGKPGVAAPTFEADEFMRKRRLMVTHQIAFRGIKDPATLAAMRRVPRHEFVPLRQRTAAYHDTPLPIGHGQTISQPFIVGYMTEILELDENSRVLEVGTGSGYQAAILAEIVAEVVTLEIVRPLAESVAKRLRKLGYRNITVLHGDGYYGREDKAPYDAIIVTAAATHVPPPLIEQLKPGGRMVIPVANSAWTQNLLLVHKNKNGKIATQNVLSVLFVPLTGDH